MFGHDVNGKLIVQELEYIPHSDDNNELINYKYIDNRFNEKREIG